MILSRITKHLKQQHWTAVLLDFVIVVLGVFIGIQVSNWNAARLRAAQQHVYLERLRTDFEGIRDRIKEHFAIYNNAVEGGDYILTIVRADEADFRKMKIDGAKISRGFSGLNSPRIPPPAPATYDEMVSEGALSDIRNLELRDKLAGYARLQGVVQEVAHVVNDHFVRQSPILNRYFITHAVVDPRALSGIHDDVVSYDIEGMRGDRDFAIAVTLLRDNALNSLEQRKIQMREIDEILSLLDKELG